jgi:ferritin-like metal-binding protein YciE
MATMRGLEDLFVDKLKDIYDAEKRITRALPKMARTASSEELSAAFEEHLQQTEGQIERLDRIFESLGKSPGRKPCHGMMGILEEGQELMGEDADESVMDAGLIASAQEVEHYEIGAYGTLRAWAQVLGREEEANLLQESLQEEEQTDEKLNQLAETINAQAASGDEEGEESEEGDEDVESEEGSSMAMAGSGRGRSASGSRSNGGNRSSGSRSGGSRGGSRSSGSRSAKGRR